MDKTGISSAKKIKELFGAKIADLSTVISIEDKNKVKDISDYIKHGYDKDRLHEFLRSFYPDKSVLEDSSFIDGIENTIKGTKGFKGEYNGIDGSVYDNLPPLLKEVCKPMIRPHERDLVFLSSLCALSNIIPVQGTYGGKKCYPNLYLFATGSASAGKGAIRWARKLVEGVHKGMAAEYFKQMEKYEALDDKEKREAKKPQMQKYIIPGNASMAALTKQLSKNGGFGTIIESEADTLNVAMKQEWGNYSDLLRKAHEFETVSSIRNNEENSYEIDSPRLSVVLTGTENQLISFIPSVENGLFSRFMFMEIPLIEEWISQFNNPIDLDEYYRELGKVLNTFYFMEKNSKTVELAENQIERFDQNLAQFQNQLHDSFGDDVIASVRRIAGMHFRICMLLSGIRFYNDFRVAKNWEYGKLICSDVDFEIANKITEFLIENLKKAMDLLPKPRRFKGILHSKQIKLFDAHGDEFTYSQNLSKAKELGIPKSSAENWLRKFVELDLVEMCGGGDYRKIKN